MYRGPTRRLVAGAVPALSCISYVPVTGHAWYTFPPSSRHAHFSMSPSPRRDIVIIGTAHRSCSSQLLGVAVVPVALVS